MGNHKWSCTKCTYENESEVVRCALCNSPRVIRPTRPSEKMNKEQSPTHKEENEWECRCCTYLNLSKSLVCTLCNEARECFETSKELIVDNKVTGREENKWTCAVCTLMNWPKSKFCVMCRTRRGEEDEPVKYNDDNSCWLDACLGILNDSIDPVRSYVSQFANISQALSRTTTASDVDLLLQMSGINVDIGSSLTSLSKDFLRSNVAKYLFSVCNGRDCYLPISSINKKTPCQIVQVVAKKLRDGYIEALKVSQLPFHPVLSYMFPLFVLPQDIYKLHPYIQNVLISNIVDFNVTDELEVQEKVINWWCTSVKQSADWISDDNRSLSCLKGSNRFHSPLGNCLYPLWNRSCGDCLLDSVMQSVCGVLDSEQTLRNLMVGTLQRSNNFFYQRWREYETSKASDLRYELNTIQLHKDWNNILAIAKKPGESLEQIHIFVLANIFRRPILVYSIKFVRNYRNEAVGLANYQGIYLPLMWKCTQCHKNPLVLGYTRGHFCSLVALQSVSNLECNNAPDSVGLLPLPVVTNGNMMWSEGLDETVNACNGDRYLRSCVDWQVQRQVLARVYVERYFSLFTTRQSSPHADDSIAMPKDQKSPSRESPEQLQQQQPEQQQQPTSDITSSKISYLDPPHFRHISNRSQHHVVNLPLYDSDGNFMPIPFHTLTEKFDGSLTALREWLNISANKLGLPLLTLRWSATPKSSQITVNFISNWLQYYNDLEESLSLDDGCHKNRDS